MIRTQIYLHDVEKLALKKISRHTGLSQSALIRQAIDEFISKYIPLDRRQALQQARGMWRDRTDLPDFHRLRREIDRIFPSEEK